MWKYGFGKTPPPLLDFSLSSSSWNCQSVSEWISHNFRFAIYKQLLVMQLLSAQSVSWPNWHSWHSRNSGPSWHSRNSGHSWPSWPSGAGLAHLAVLAYSSSSISKLSNPAVCNSAIYRIYRALWAFQCATKMFRNPAAGWFMVCKKSFAMLYNGLEKCNKCALRAILSSERSQSA